MQDLNDKITGNTLTALEWNEVPSELQNVIEALGITLSSGDLNQLGKAIAGYVANGDFYTDSGAADAYVLSVVGSKQAPPSYTDGMLVRFLAVNANTGGAVTINVAGLGVKSLTDEGGNAPAIGFISGHTSATYDLANDRFELVGASGKQLVQIFTASGTYTPTPGVKSIEVTAIGAGGGGGGSDGAGAGTAIAAAGGGAGGASVLISSDIDASYAVVIGAGGGGGSGTGGVTGGAGGTTTVISTGVSLSCTGGTGGGGGVGTAGSIAVSGGSAGSATGGDLNHDGGDGSNGSVVNGEIASLGDAGGSLFGGSKRGAIVGAGQAGTVFGSGGSGGSSLDVATDFDGGNGVDGVVVIKELF